jgi:hypothetical protein
MMANKTIFSSEMIFPVEGKSMGENCLPGRDVKSAIPVIVAVSFPYPAVARAIYLFVESLVDISGLRSFHYDHYTRERN